jgi:hypothetical protein
LFALYLVHFFLLIAGMSIFTLAFGIALVESADLIGDFHLGGVCTCDSNDSVARRAGGALVVRAAIGRHCEPAVVGTNNGAGEGTGIGAGVTVLRH